MPLSTLGCSGDDDRCQGTPRHPAGKGERCIFVTIHATGRRCKRVEVAGGAVQAAGQHQIHPSTTAGRHMTPALFSPLSELSGPFHRYQCIPCKRFGYLPELNTRARAHTTLLLGVVGQWGCLCVSPRRTEVEGFLPSCSSSADLLLASFVVVPSANIYNVPPQILPPH
jgi:hypothetical protein